MKTVKDLIRELLTQPEHFANLAQAEENDERKAFYTSVSKVMTITPEGDSNILEVGIDAFSHLVRYVYLLQDIINIKNNMSDYRFRSYFNSFKVNKSQQTAKIEMVMEYGSIRVEYAMERYKKISKIFEEVKALLLKFKDKKIKQIMQDYFSDEVAQKAMQEAIKNQTNAIKSLIKPVYIYFSHTNHADHYIYLGQSENQHSCMSKDYEYFGLYYRGRDVHPLMGYAYAPDFALALVSEYSPEGLASLLTQHDPDYPFIARSMVFTSYEDYDKPSYARIYGNELCQDVFRKTFHRCRAPKGRELYGVLVSDISNRTIERVQSEYDSIGDLLHHFRQDEEYAFVNTQPQYLLAVPYVDEYSNYLKLKNKLNWADIKEDQRDGFTKIPVVVQDRDEDYSPPDSEPDDQNWFGTLHFAGIALAIDEYENLNGLFYIDTDKDISIYWE